MPALHGMDALMVRAVEACSVGVTIADATMPNQPLVYVNTAFELTTGYPAADVLGENCRLLQGPETDLTVVAELRAAISAGRDHVAVLRNYRRNGEPWWNELRLSAINDDDGRLTHYLGFQNDVTARVEAEQRVAHEASHDPLTGMPNRGHILTRLAKAVAEAEVSGTQVAVLFVDLDGFKSINDQLGHAAGDRALILASARLRAGLRDDDLLGRHSGDEFVAVLRDVDAGLALSVARRAVRSVRAHEPDSGVRLSASVGVALFPDHGRTASDLLNSADDAMYVAKDSGRGRALLARRRRG